jgi:hypothetical protein
MKTARQNTRQEKLFVFSLVYLTGSTPIDIAKLFSAYKYRIGVLSKVVNLL